MVGALAAGLAIAVSGGAALAVNKVCPESGACRGTQQADGLTGTNGVNKIVGLGGNDVVYGYGADDKINGGPGDDFLRGDDGNDAIQGRAGLDSLIGSKGNDTLTGDADADAPGTDNVAGGPGNDLEYGGPGNDLLGNIVFGSTTVTDRGRDQLFGGSGNDRFYTVDGFRDTIDCGTDEDTAYVDNLDVASETCENVFVKEDRSPASGSFPVAGRAELPAGARAVR